LDLDEEQPIYEFSVQKSMIVASKSSAIIRSYLSLVVIHNFVASFTLSTLSSVGPLIRHGTLMSAKLVQSSSNSDDAATFDATYHRWEDNKDAAVSQCILPLSRESHKGCSGRIAVLGGSELYTGAPYFAGLAALRTGADLLSLLTAHEATLPLKCYSPDFMVQSVYTAPELHASCFNVPLTHMIDTVMAHLKEKRIHCCVIGPGLGRHPNVLVAVALIVIEARKLGIYLVLDADALSVLSQPGYRNLLKGYDKAILTPNVVEYQRLMDGNSGGENNLFDSVTIVQKGSIDTIWLDGQVRYQCGEPGGMKRCGGIGDVLAGTVGTLVAWQAIRAANEARHSSSGCFQVNIPLACWTACCIVRRATQRAFDVKKRAMSAQDILDHLGPTMEDMTF
jgi:ATP-dependent NAD(P)H-hydrate dehydratase